MIIDFNKIKNIDTSIYKKDFDFPGYPGPLDYTHHLFRETGEHYKLLTYIHLK